MKAHIQRTARLQLIANMLEGQPWQKAMTNAGLSLGRSTAYRLVQLARDPQRSERAFLDNRHGHPYKLTELMRSWIVEYCTQHPGVYSSQVSVLLSQHHSPAQCPRQSSEVPGSRLLWPSPSTRRVVQPAVRVPSHVGADQELFHGIAHILTDMPRYASGPPPVWLVALPGRLRLHRPLRDLDSPGRLPGAARTRF